MSLKAKVLKRLVVDGKTLEPNEIVDISKWRNAKTLEGGRYIALVTHVSETPKEETVVAETPKPTKAKKEDK